MTVKVSASILSADFAHLGEQVAYICRKGADLIHFDVMDGHFVPNMTFGAPVLRAIKPYAIVPIDVHLLIDNPEQYIDQFIDAGANFITIHYEINGDVTALLDRIRSKGVRAGLCLKPATPVSVLEPFLDHLDLILLMSVEPGFGGQHFMEDKLSKIVQAKQLIGSRSIEISVDGGINDKTGNAAANSGADILVAGHYIFKSYDPAVAIQTLKGF